MELKGQMVFCPESDSLLFVASPFLDGLEGLTGRGLYISDIPIHDATRDVILVGEQSRAQVRPHFLANITCQPRVKPLSRGPNISFALDANSTLVHRLIYINQRNARSANMDAHSNAVWNSTRIKPSIIRGRGNLIA